MIAEVERPVVASRRSLFLALGGLWLPVAAFFLFLAICAYYYDYFPADLRIAHALQAVDVPAFGGFIDFVNIVGRAPAFVPLTLVVMIVCATRRLGWEAILLALSLVPGYLVPLIKDFVERPRPSPDLINVSEQPGDYAFPSGHTAHTGALFLVLFFVIPVIVPWRPARWLLQAGCVLLIAAAGPARVYVGAHWPSDTLGSYLLVLLILGPALALYLGLRHAIRPESRV